MPVIGQERVQMSVNDQISALDLELATLMKEMGANEPSVSGGETKETRQKAPQGGGFIASVPQSDIINQTADDKPQRTPREAQLDAALREERAKRKDEQRKRREMEERDARRQENFERLMANLAARQNAGPASYPASAQNEPSIEGLDYITQDELTRDPIGTLTKIANGYNLMVQVRRSTSAAEAQRAANQAQVSAQQTQLAKAQTEFIRQFDEIETEFAEEVPDYNLACEYAVRARVTQLKTQFPGASDQSIAATLQREMLGAAWEAQAQGLNPAEMAYRTAISLGYNPEAGRAYLAKVANGEDPAQPVSGEAKKPAAPAAKAKSDPDAADPLRHIREGQKAAKSAGAGGGQAPPADTDLDALLDLDGHAFAEAMDRFVSKQTRAR